MSILSCTTVFLFFSLAFQSSFCFGAGFSTIVAQQTYNKHVAPAPTTKKAPARKVSFILPKNWLCALSEDVQQKIREMLMGTKWVAYQELIAHKLSPVLTRQVYAGFIPFPSLFSHPINNEKISHPDYGTLSFAKEPESVDAHGRPAAQYRITLTHEHIATSYVLDAHDVHKVYFAPDDSTILVEYSNHDLKRSWTCLDPISLKPLVFTAWGIPDKEAFKLFFSDIVNKDRETHVELPGIPLTSSSNGRFISWVFLSGETEHGFVDITTRTILFLYKKIIDAPGQHLSFHPIPDSDSSQLFINYGDCVTVIDYARQTRVARLALRKACIPQGFVDRKTVDAIPRIVNQTAQEQRAKALLVAGITGPLLVMPKKPSTILCIMLEGVLSGALDELQEQSHDGSQEKGESKEEKRDDAADKKAKIAQFFDIIKKLKIMKEHPAVAQYTASYPTLGRRYAYSYDHLYCKLRTVFPLRDFPAALDVFLESYNEELDSAIIVNLDAYLQSSASTRNFRDGRELHHYICQKFPQFNHPNLAPKLTHGIEVICHTYGLPPLAVSEKTIDNDIQALCAGNTALEPLIQEWLSNYFVTYLARFSSMQAIKDALVKRFDCKGISTEQLERWCTAIELAIEPHIIEFYKHTKNIYPDRLWFIEHLITEFPIFSQLPLHQQQAIVSVLSYETNIHSWGIKAKTITRALNLINKITLPFLKTELIENVGRYMVDYYDQEKFQYYDMTKIKEDISQSFPAFTTLSADAQELLAQEVTNRFAHRSTAPRWRLGAAVANAGGGARAVAVATTLYDHRKSIGIVASTAAVLWALHKKTRILQRLIP